MSEPGMVTHAGGCHCGAVRFEVLAPKTLQVSECNCSICSRTGYLHLIVPADRFRLVSGSDALKTYTFNTQTAQHLIETISAVRLLGAQVVLTGVRPTIAQTLVHLGIDLSDMITRSSLAAGLQVALDRLSLQVVTRDGSHEGARHGR